MCSYHIVNIKEVPEMIAIAANWFCKKWEIPQEEYQTSMNDCIEEKSAVPQWYIVLNQNKIIAGIGVIENDFHNRKDLAPNVCALYVEKQYRKKGIAGELLQFVCKDMKKKGISTLYLITDHDSFYERYGWEYLCMVESEQEQIRMYVHKE